ncbi:hypothetical protein [Nonomuraea sp. NPDC049480]|uniref:hypothetical protein n=1 Tax=Nonomuraea sp. NPDC049480 TaxID=3364353 RepID=UPI003791708C
MNAGQLIESYVSDVARLLPGAQRADVALELRTLLRDELADRAEVAGREPDEELARRLLAGFGRPAEVAARYRPAPALIDPADTRRFLRVAIIGMAVIWLLGLLDLLRRRPVNSLDGALYALREWWTVGAIPALWWPGVMFVCFAGAAWVNDAAPGSPESPSGQYGGDPLPEHGLVAGVRGQGHGQPVRDQAPASTFTTSYTTRWPACADSESRTGGPADRGSPWVISV